jgi:hypothetical protein
MAPKEQSIIMSATKAGIFPSCPLLLMLVALLAAWLMVPAAARAHPEEHEIGACRPYSCNPYAAEGEWRHPSSSSPGDFEEESTPEFLDRMRRERRIDDHLRHERWRSEGYWPFGEQE